jgi:type IV fimbrial biogenesis protein FimT
VLGDAQGRELPVTGAGRARGVTLIELLIALALGMMLIVLAVPAYNTWVSETEEQTAAGSIADGLRYATAEAIKRNQNVEFAVDANGWAVTTLVGSPAVPVVLRENERAEGSYRATRTPLPVGRTTVTFNSLGGIEAANADASLPFDTINVSVPNSARPAGLRVIVPTVGGTSGIKVCNPALAYPADPRGCP